MNHRGWWLLLVFSLAVAGAGWYSGARWTAVAAQTGFEAGLATALETVERQQRMIDRHVPTDSTCVLDLWTGQCWWWDGRTRRPGGWPPEETP